MSNMYALTCLLSVLFVYGLQIVKVTVNLYKTQRSDPILVFTCSTVCPVPHSCM